MESPDFHMFVFGAYLSADVQLAGLRIEIDTGDPDGESDVHSCGGGAAGGGFVCDAPDGGGAKNVCGSYEVVGVPLE